MKDREIGKEKVQGKKESNTFLLDKLGQFRYI